MDCIEEFLRTLNSDEIAKEINEVNNCRNMRFIVADLSPEAISTCLKDIYKESVIAALNCFFIYLRHYHEWINEQI